ncbi:MAG: hypothetical protein WC668_04915 [Patescibacteria group bacterium]|jgi:hypothetical protein
MILLLLRIFPYLAAVAFFLLCQALFYWPGYWSWFFIVILAVPSIYFFLIKSNHKTKSVTFAYLYSLIFVIAGFVFLLILESFYVLNLFLLSWAFLFWLYLEVVFHDFYETAKVSVANLNNLHSYFDILIIFFLTAALVNFSIFLNWPAVVIVPILSLVYFVLYYWLYLKYLSGRRNALIYALIQAIVLTELLFLLLFWPVSFYVLAILLSATYYLMLSLSLSSPARLTKGNKGGSGLRAIFIFSLVVVLTLITAIWL